LAPPTQLGPLPALRYLQDSGLAPHEAPRAIIGSALLPCIFVNDVLPLDRRIKESPYYVLEYRQYWHRLWSDLIPAGTTRTMTEVTGMLSGAQTQNNMRNSIDMSIGVDWNIRFGTRSNPFSQQITRNLNVLRSNTITDLGERTEQVRYLNPNPTDVRYARFAVGHEYVLRRMNGTQVASWVAVDNRSMYLLTFPTNASIIMENNTILSADSSYDLSVWKTPMKIKNGQVIQKNEYNSKQYNE
ncbi:Larvicidal toxin protein, partial [Bacillus thuringiensis]|nr:Larvicidal toxin protein [Bacillus thuringiensis]